MSVKAMTWAWEQDLRPGAKLILVALADHSDGNGVCWPGHDLIAEKTGLSRQTVSENITALEAGGLLTIERTRNEKGRAGRVRYFLCLDRASKCSDGAPPMSGKPTLESKNPMSGNPTLGLASNVGFRPFPMSALPVPYKEEPKAIEPRARDSLFAIGRAELERWFNAWLWPRYPKNQNGKREALVELLKLKPDGPMLEAIAAGVDHRIAAEKVARARSGDNFFPEWPDCHRWIKKRRWEDRFDAPAAGGSTGNNRAACIACGKPSHSEIDGKAYCRACDPFGREQWAKRGGDDGRAGAG